MIIINDAIDAINEGRDVPVKIGEFKLKWISTDPWRGYYDAIPTKKSGWIKASDGWVTGNWLDAGDNAANKKELELDQLDAQAQKEGKEMCVVFTPTSNVFSTCYDVFLRKLNKN